MKYIKAAKLAVGVATASGIGIIVKQLVNDNVVTDSKIKSACVMISRVTLASAITEAVNRSTDRWIDSCVDAFVGGIQDGIERGKAKGK